MQKYSVKFKYFAFTYVTAVTWMTDMQVAYFVKCELVNVGLLLHQPLNLYQ